MCIYKSVSLSCFFSPSVSLFNSVWNDRYTWEFGVLNNNTKLLKKKKKNYDAIVEKATLPRRISCPTCVIINHISHCACQWKSKNQDWKYESKYIQIYVN